MSDESSLARFVEALHADEALRDRIAGAERAASDNIERASAAIRAVASDAGFDISDWTLRPDTVTPSPTSQELAARASGSCCWFLTSTI